MKKTLLVAALAAFVFVPAFAEKIGVVDVARIFKEYTRAQNNTKSLQSATEDAKKDLGAREAALKKLNDEVESAKKDVDNPTLNEAARAAKKSELQTKFQALQKAGNEFLALRQQIAGGIQQRAQILQEEIFKQTREAAAAIAKSKGLELVLPNTAAFYSADSLDVTTDVLKKLNEDYAANPVTVGAPVVAPADAKPAPAAPAAK